MFGLENMVGFFKSPKMELSEREELKKLTPKDVIKNIKVENNITEKEMEEKITNEAETQVEEVVVEDVQEVVSEEPEVQEQEIVEEPKIEEPVAEIEPSAKEENAGETIVEEVEQEEPQDEEPQEKSIEEVVAEDEQPAEQPEVAEEVVEEIAVVEEQEKEEVVVPENVATPTNAKIDVVNAVSNDELLKKIEILEAEKAQKEIELQKMSLEKEVERDYAGVAGKIEDKVDTIFEIKNSSLSENTKTFILNSLKSLSVQNLADCEEIGHDQEIEVDEVSDKKTKLEKAIKEYGLTENQAFLYVNGDRTLAEAKKFSNKVRNRK